jgi:hypothetical protein
VKKTSIFNAAQKHKEDLFNLNLIFSKEIDAPKKIFKGFSLDSDDLIRTSDAYKVGTFIVKSRKNPLLFIYAFIYAFGLDYHENENSKKVDKFIKLIEDDQKIKCKSKSHKTYKYGKIVCNKKINFFHKIKLLIEESKVR